MPNLPIQPPVVPEGFCQTLTANNWVQQIVNLMSQAVAIFTDVGTIILDQEAQPNPNQRTFLWRRRSTGLIYRWDGGAWVTPHLDPPSGDVRRWWKGNLTALQTYDGGDTDPVGTNSGPMWENDPDDPGRSPMTPGTIPTSNPSKTLAVAEQYGEGAHQLTMAELPASMPMTATLPGWKTNLEVASPPQWLAPSGSGGGVGGDTGDASFPMVNTGGGQSHQTTHPVFGLYCIRRTARVNYKAS